MTLYEYKEDKIETEKHLADIDEYLVSMKQTVSEVDDAILLAKEELEKCQTTREEHIRDYNSKVQEERLLKEHLQKLNADIYEEERRISIEQFVAAQETFDELLKPAFFGHIGKINQEATFSKPISIQPAWDMLEREFKNPMEFREHVLAYRAAKNRYNSLLQEIGDMMFKKIDVPHSKSISVSETYKALLNNEHVLQRIGCN